MDRQCDYHIPGSLLGCLRHGAAAGGRRWRKLPPEAGAVTVADTGVNSDADPEPDSVGDAVTGADAITEHNTDPGAEPDSGTVAKCNAGTVADAQRVSNGHADTESVAQRDGNPDSVGHAVAEGHALGDCAGRLPDPPKGSGGRNTPLPAAAQAAGRRAGAHRHQRRPAD